MVVVSIIYSLAQFLAQQVCRSDCCYRTEADLQHQETPKWCKRNSWTNTGPDLPSILPPSFLLLGQILDLTVQKNQIISLCLRPSNSEGRAKGYSIFESKYFSLDPFTNQAKILVRVVKDQPNAKYKGIHQQTENLEDGETSDWNRDHKKLYNWYSKSILALFYLGQFESRTRPIPRGKCQHQPLVPPTFLGVTSSLQVLPG